MTEQGEIRASDRERSGIVQEVLDALKGLRYGSVEITVHDGRVAQIDRRERRRFPAADPVRPSKGAA